MITESAAAFIAIVFSIVSLAAGFAAGRWLGGPNDPRI